jgi:hypothetical protein
MAERINPSKGSRPEKIMRDALMLELAREDLIDGEKVRRARRVAASLVNKALDGDVAAIKEINDRIDGKVAQTSVIEGGERPIETVALTPMEAARRVAFVLDAARRQITDKDD